MSNTGADIPNSPRPRRRSSFPCLTRPEETHRGYPKIAEQWFACLMNHYASRIVDSLPHDRQGCWVSFVRLAFGISVDRRVNLQLRKSASLTSHPHRCYLHARAPENAMVVCGRLTNGRYERRRRPLALVSARVGRDRPDSSA